VHPGQSAVAEIMCELLPVDKIKGVIECPDTLFIEMHSTNPWSLFGSYNKQ